jgi:hypothetical protein
MKTERVTMQRTKSILIGIAFYLAATMIATLSYGAPPKKYLKPTSAAALTFRSISVGMCPAQRTTLIFVPDSTNARLTVRFEGINGNRWVFLNGEEDRPETWTIAGEVEYRGTAIGKGKYTFKLPRPFLPSDSIPAVMDNRSNLRRHGAASIFPSSFEMRCNSQTAHVHDAGTVFIHGDACGNSGRPSPHWYPARTQSAKVLKCVFDYPVGDMTSAIFASQQIDSVYENADCLGQEGTLRYFMSPPSTNSISSESAMAFPHSDSALTFRTIRVGGLDPIYPAQRTTFVLSPGSPDTRLTVKFEVGKDTIEAFIDGTEERPSRWSFVGEAMYQGFARGTGKYEFRLTRPSPRRFTFPSFFEMTWYRQTVQVLNAGAQFTYDNNCMSGGKLPQWQPDRLQPVSVVKCEFDSTVGDISSVAFATSRIDSIHVNSSCSNKKGAYRFYSSQPSNLLPKSKQKK